MGLIENYPKILFHANEVAGWTILFYFNKSTVMYSENIILQSQNSMRSTVGTLTKWTTRKYFITYKNSYKITKSVIIELLN